MRVSVSSLEFSNALSASYERASVPMSVSLSGASDTLANPRYIAGLFGYSKAHSAATRNTPAIILDIKSRYVFRRVAGRTIEARLAPIEFKILFVLCAAGGVVSSEQLLELLYGERADGGPIYAATALSVRICRMRRKVAKFGISIEPWYGIGLRVSASHSLERG